MASKEEKHTCGGCEKKEAEAGGELQRCSGCRQAWYCSRDCQKADWKLHKKFCVASSKSKTGTNANPSAKGDSTTAPPEGGTKALELAISKPFHKLNDKKWLYDRPEADVFKLLVDVFRLRLEDSYKFDGDVETDTIYNGCRTSKVAFRRFLRELEGKPGLLPPWWSPEKAAECIDCGLRGSWTNLSRVAEKSDIIEHYGDPLMPMQMRMFGEQIFGRTPGGMSGAMMMEMQMMAESGDTETRLHTFNIS